MINSNAPAMIRNKSPLPTEKQAVKEPEKIKYKKILGEFWKIMSDQTTVRVRTQKNFRPNPKEMIHSAS